MSTAIKICGITSVVDARMVSQAGADYLGVLVNVRQSPRSVDMNTASRIIEAAANPVIVLAYDHSIDDLKVIQSALRPSGVQLAGTESYSSIEAIRGTVKGVLLKDASGDGDIIKGIAAGIRQLPRVRETLTDYFDGRIEGEVRLKDIFFTEYKAIFRELDEMEKLCTQFDHRHHRRLFRSRFSSAIPHKTRTIQREALARIDIAVKKLKTDVRALLENLLEHNPVRQLLREASISVHLDLSSTDSAYCKVLAREHELFNAFYEVIRNVLHHAFKDTTEANPSTTSRLPFSSCAIGNADSVRLT